MIDFTQMINSYFYGIILDKENRHFPVCLQQEVELRIIWFSYL